MSSPHPRPSALVVLAVFLATIVVTALAPFVQTTDYRWICSADGTRRVAVDDASTSAHAAHDTADADDGHARRDTHDPHDRHDADDHAAHCPLCMPAGAPPPAPTVAFEPVQPLAHALCSIPAARLAALVGAPLPARGPPVPS